MGRYTLVAGIGENHLPNDTYATVIEKFRVPGTEVWFSGKHFGDFVTCVVDSGDDWSLDGIRFERHRLPHLPHYDDTIKSFDLVFYPEFQAPENFEALSYYDWFNKEIRFPLTENRKISYGKYWCFVGIIVASIHYSDNEPMILRPEDIFSAEEIYQKLVEKGRLRSGLTFQVIENCCG